MRFRTYVIVPYVPPAAVAKRGLGRAAAHAPAQPAARPLTRGARRTTSASLRESLVHTENIVSDLEALDLATQLLAGPEVAELLYRRFNPSTVASGYFPRLVVLGELDEVGDARAAVAAAEQLREQIAASPVDFDDSRFIGVEQDLERVHYVSSVPDFTEFGWLLRRDGDRPPVRAQRPRPRARPPPGAPQGTRTTQAHARLHRARRSATAAGRRRRDDRPAGGDRALLEELRGHERASIHAVSIYQTVREPGPLADPDEPRRGLRARRRRRSATRPTPTRSTAAGCRSELWLSTLPLGRDVAQRRKKYVSKHVGDTIPLIGPSCGSPTGMPFFFAEGVRTLENLNPWDRAFSTA